MKDKDTKKKGMTARPLASITLFCAGMWIVPSGLALHLVSSQGITKLSHFFMSIHNTAALIFLTAAVVHATQNRKVLTNYIKVRAGELVQYRREFLIAALSISAIVLFVASHVLHLS